MKKFLISLMFIFLSITFVTGGVCLLQGCSYSTPGNGGGGNTESPETPENPDPEDPDEDVNPNWTTTHNFTINTKVKQIGGDTYYPDYSSTNSSDKYQVASTGCFDIYWYCDDGSTGNLTSSSESYEYISSQGLSYTTSASNSTNKLGLINATYTYNNIFSYKRYAKIVPHVNGSYTSKYKYTKNPSGSTYSSNPVYIYGSGDITANESTAKSGCTHSLTGTYTVYFAEGATYYFYGSSLVGQGNTAVATRTGYAGEYVYMPDFTGKTPVGYTFAGWTWDPNGSTVYKKGDGFNVNNNYNPHVSWTSFHAKFVGNTVNLTLHADGGSIVSTTGWTGSGASVYRSNSYGDYLYDTALPTPTRTGYTFIGWRKNFLDVYSYANWINQKTDTSSKVDVTFTNKVMNMEPNRCYHLVNGSYEAYTYSVSLPVAGRYRMRYYGYTDRTDGNYAGLFRVSTNGSTIKSVEETQIKATSRTYYEQLIDVTEKTTAGVYFSWNYAGMCHLDNIVLELMYPTSGAYPSDALVGKYYDYHNDETLYAQWEINTYTLTVNYYGGTSRQTNTTNLSVTASSCSPTSATITTGNSAKFTHTYSTASYTLTMARANTSYNYYIAIGAIPSTSSSLNSKAYTWTPTADTSISVYIYQRYQISYSSNNGSGTAPSTQYKIHGSSITLGTNSLTRTSYTANGWNTNSSGTGTQYASGATYSDNSTSRTLYANWTPKTCTLNVKIMTSTNGSAYTNSATGGEVIVGYRENLDDNMTYECISPVTEESWSNPSVLISQLVTFAPTANTGYVFAGMSTSTSAPYNTSNLSFTPTTQGASYTYYAYFNKLSGNIVKYVSKNSATYSNISVENVGGNKFKQNADGFWESQNWGFHNSYALAKVSFTLTNTANVVFDVINYAESTYDFGIFSNLNSTLTASNAEDSSNVKLSFKGNQKSSVQNVIYENVSPGTYYVYVKYRKDGSANANNDSLQFRIATEISNDSYFYFEDGYFPQSYVGDALNSTLGSTTNITFDRNLKYLDASGNTVSIPIYTYSGEKYAKVTKNSVTKWFKMEKIKWRLSDYDGNVASTWIGRGKFNSNIKVVSDRVLWVGAITRANTKEGWKFNESNMRTYFSEIYKKNGASVSGEMPTFGISYNEKSYYYGPAGQQEKVKYTTSSYSGINIATEEEIKMNLTDLRARASDMVAFILGLNEDSYCDYWTRELGGSLKNGKMITNSGMTKSAWLQNFYGVRFSLRMSEGSRV